MLLKQLHLKPLAFVLLVFSVAACQTRPPALPHAGPATQNTPLLTTPLPAASANSPITANLLLGNPSKASTDPADKNNFLMIKPYYALSYNNAAGEPNWVSWQLAKQDLGTAPRRRTFAEDTTLPPGFTRITHRDYTNSGFDRGHQCPHSDRAADRTMAYATFVMTNIVPQAPNLNQKAWNQEELYLQDLAGEQNDRIYIIAGPAGSGGTGKNGFAATIADGKVKVPANCWKIAVILPPATPDTPVADLARINQSTRVLAVIMPNDNTVGEAWAQYRTSVNAIEKATGFDFFSNLPPAIATALKAKIDTEPLPSRVIQYDPSNSAPRPANPPLQRERP